MQDGRALAALFFDSALLIFLSPERHREAFVQISVAQKLQLLDLVQSDCRSVPLPPEHLATTPWARGYSAAA